MAYMHNTCAKTLGKKRKNKKKEKIFTILRSSGLPSNIVHLGSVRTRTRSMESTTSVQFRDIQATLFFRVVMNYSSILLFFFLGKKKRTFCIFPP